MKLLIILFILFLIITNATSMELSMEKQVIRINDAVSMSVLLPEETWWYYWENSEANENWKPRMTFNIPAYQDPQKALFLDLYLEPSDGLMTLMEIAKNKFKKYDYPFTSSLPFFVPPSDLNQAKTEGVYFTARFPHRGSLDITNAFYLFNGYIIRVVIDAPSEDYGNALPVINEILRSIEFSNP